MIGKVQLDFGNKLEARVILRHSSDGTIKVVEDVNGNLVVLKDDAIVGVYQDKGYAFQEYGRLTRQKKAQEGQ